MESSKLDEQSLTKASIRPINFIQNSKPQISRQLLESLIIALDPTMPLAQNYKDDVSLLESEAAISKAKMACSTTELNMRPETNTKVDVSINI